MLVREMLYLLGVPSTSRSPTGSDRICASGTLLFVPSLTIGTRMPYVLQLHGGAAQIRTELLCIKVRLQGPRLE